MVIKECNSQETNAPRKYQIRLRAERNPFLFQQ